MDKILKRDAFINEVYEPMMEQKRYEELVSVNEGLLKNLFGMVKNLFKKDWETIKGDPTVISIYKEIDDSLTGFSTMKLSKKGECNQIRQELVDFASDWYEKKINDAKKNDSDPVPAKSTKFKDETLKQNFEICQNKIKEIAKGDEQMTRWAKILMDDMKVVINRSVYADIQDEETKKELEKQNKEELKKQEEINKKMEKFQNDQLNEIQKDRERLISDMEATPEKADILGDKAVQNICGEFDKIRRETKSNQPTAEQFKNDSKLGLKSLYSDDDFGKEETKIAYRLMDSFYKSLEDNKIRDKFKETPSQSVQAMCIAINAFIKNCVFETEDYGKALPLMAKCAIISDGTVSYNLPLNDKTGDEAGNYFTDIAKIITDGQLKGTNGKNIKLPNNFKANAKTLLNKIVGEAKKLKETADKNYNDRLKTLKLGDEE